MFSWTEERGTYSASRNTNKVNSRSVRIIKLPKKRQTLAGKKKAKRGAQKLLINGRTTVFWVWHFVVFGKNSIFSICRIEMRTGSSPIPIPFVSKYPTSSRESFCKYTRLIARTLDRAEHPRKVDVKTV